MTGFCFVLFLSFMLPSGTQRLNLNLQAFLTTVGCGLRFPPPMLLYWTGIPLSNQSSFVADPMKSSLCKVTALPTHFLCCIVSHCKGLFFSLQHHGQPKNQKST